MKEKIKKRKYRNSIPLFIFIFFALLPSLQFILALDSDSITFPLSGKENITICPSAECESVYYQYNSDGYFYPHYVGEISTTASIQEKKGNWYFIDIHREAGFVYGESSKIYFDDLFTVGWLHESLIPENIRQEFTSQEEQVSQIEEDQTQKGKDEIQDNSIALFSFLKYKNSRIDSIVALIFMVFSLIVFLTWRKIRTFFQSKIKRFKISHFLNKKIILVISSIVILGIVGIKITQYIESTQQEIEKLRLETQKAITEITSNAELREESAQKILEESQQELEAEQAKRLAQEEIARQRIVELESKISQSPSYDLASIIEQWKPIVAYIECEFRYSDTNWLYDQRGGSGTAIKWAGSDDVAILTNKHVIISSKGYGPNSCTIKLSDSYATFISSDTKYSAKGYDWGNIYIKNPNEYLQNITTSQPKFCEGKPSLGDEIIILGYPSISGENNITATDGIIAGYDGDYYITSAKVEEGNSGGLAVLLKENCFLGIPTYAIVGQIESLARILDINTVFK